MIGLSQFKEKNIKRKNIMQKSKTKTMATIAVMTAVMCILGPLSIPIGPVPISLQAFTVLLAVYVLGMKDGTIALLIYLLLGLVGVPVFSGYTAGPAKLLGPTGGYIIGFIFQALIAGYFIDRFYNKVWLQFVGMVLGLIVLYAFGTAWLAFSAHMTAGAALMAGVIPFIPFDIAKIIVAMLLGRPIRKRLNTFILSANNA